MQKSMYSLTLSDSVVAAVDETAGALKTSRSNLIDRILAEHLHVTTFEQTTKMVYSMIEDIICASNVFSVLSEATENMLKLRSAVAYKYNPVIRYCIRLNRDMSGTLNAFFRTKNPQLLNELNEFYSLWLALEKGAGETNGENARAEGNVFIRAFAFKNRHELTAGIIADAVCDYIRTFDQCIKAYFNGGELFEQRIIKRYGDYQSTANIRL